MLYNLYLIHEYEKFCVYSQRSLEAVHKPLLAIERERPDKNRD